MQIVFSSTYLRYLAVATISASTNNVILILGDRLGYSYCVLVALTFMVTGNVAYFLHSYFTFRRHVSWIQYINFMIGIALGSPVALAFIIILRELLGLSMPIAAPVATGLMIVYNYISARMAITLLPFWRRKRGHPGNA